MISNGGDRLIDRKQGRPTNEQGTQSSHMCRACEVPSLLQLCVQAVANNVLLHDEPERKCRLSPVLVMVVLLWLTPCGVVQLSPVVRQRPGNKSGSGAFFNSSSASASTKASQATV